MKPLLRHKTPLESYTSHFRQCCIDETQNTISPINNNNDRQLRHATLVGGKKGSILEGQYLQRDTKITNYFSNQKEPNGSHSLIKTKEMSNNIQPIQLSFDLSEETKAFISKVQTNDTGSNQPSIQLSLLESFSIREKYHNLLIRKLIIPVHYSQLLTKFIELDKELLSNKKRLRRSIIRVSASKEEIMKMLIVLPNCFNIHSLENGNNCSSIVIEANFEGGRGLLRGSLKKIREKRQKKFRNQLLQLVNTQHKAFLKKNNIINFDPFKYNTWHSDFDIESCPELPLVSHPLLV